MVRIGFWGLFYYTYDKEPPKLYWYLYRPLYKGLGVGIMVYFLLWVMRQCRIYINSTE